MNRNRKHDAQDAELCQKAAIKLVGDDDYLRIITPEVACSTSNTDLESWMKEVEYSIKNYNTYQDLGNVNGANEKTE